MGTNNITKAEIIDTVVKNTGLSKAEVKAAFDGMVNTIIDYVANGDRIELRGFGVFNHKIRQPRLARNPKTGEQVKLGKRVVPVFKPSPDFQDRVNESLESGN